MSLEDVSVTYRTGPFWNRRIVPAVKDVSLTIAEGEILGLVGESGSGKTTIGRLCLGLIEPDQGSILLRRHPFRGRRGVQGQIATVLQHPEWALNPRLTVGVSVTEPLAIQDPTKSSVLQGAKPALGEMGAATILSIPLMDGEEAIARAVNLLRRTVFFKPPSFVPGAPPAF